jgi:hypothetical protein
MIARFRPTLLLVGLCASASFAQTTDAPPKDFATMKAQITARLQKELACVEAATSQDELFACRPHPPGHPPGPPPQDK